MNLDQVVTLLKQVTDAVQNLENDAKKQNNSAYKEDTRMVALAKRYPIKGHILKGQTDIVRKYYIGTLLALSRNATSDKLLQQQQLHICRIIASYDSTVQLKEYMAHSLKTDDDYLSNFSEVFDSNTSMCFAVDLLLMNMLNERETSKKEYEMIADILQFLNLDRGDITKATYIAKAIAEQNFEQLLKLIKPSDKTKYSNFLGYYSTTQYTCIVSNIADALKTNGNVLVVNAEVLNCSEPIDLGECDAEKITFYGCSFANIKGIKGNKPPIIFDNCRFERNLFDVSEHKGFMGFGSYNDSEKDYVFIQGRRISIKNTVFTDIRASKHILDISDGEIEGCEFINCKGIALPCSYLFQIENGEISNSLFENCTMETNRADRGRTFGGVIMLTNSNLTKCDFNNCGSRGESCYGRFAKFEMQVVRAVGSKVENCHFNDCYCSSDNSSDKDVTSYILGLKNSSENNNEFKDCSSYHYHYGDIRSNYNTGQIG